MTATSTSANGIEIAPMKFCEQPFCYCRRPTHEVRVGDIGIGGDNPIRVQSMTIADTMDTAATVKEVIALYEAGCEIVRITAPSIKEAENLRSIKMELKRQKVSVPLVADIHYTPNAALIAAEIVEKVRINPGNYADKKKFEVREYTDAEYRAELERIEQRFAPLVKKCKTHGVAMRIGVNHGSLSDRVTNRYGDTPEGMVQSALEFIRICEAHGYRDLVLSMKSSNPQVMIQAYRLLAARMYELGMTYPFHLGVTEAGDGEDGRIKSAVGIGSLLEDGIGDTIRVSLTEDSIHEIPVAFALVEKFNACLTRNTGCQPVSRNWHHESWHQTAFNERDSGRQPAAAEPNRPATSDDFTKLANPFEYARRQTKAISLPNLRFGEREPVRVGVSLANSHVTEAVLQAVAGKKTNGKLPVLGDGTPISEPRAEWLEANTTGQDFRRLREYLGRFDSTVPIAAAWDTTDDHEKEFPRIVLLPVTNLSRAKLGQAVRHSVAHALHIQFVLSTELAGDPDGFDKLEAFADIIMATRLENWSVGIELAAGRTGQVGAGRALVTYLDRKFPAVPLVWRYRVPESNGAHGGINWLVDASAQLGSLLCDGLGDAIVIHGAVNPAEALRFSFNLLQATRLRSSKTEFISCPSCGRTLFDLQTTTERIKSKTGHLKGVKIAVMGCIVNGPGEMADADFGYVGTGPGKVSLYVGKDCVQRNIPEAEADQRLIELIQSSGIWVEPA